MGAPGLEQLDHQQPHAAGAGVEQHGVAGLDLEGGVDQVVGRHALQRQRRGGEIVQAVGNREGLVLIDECVAGVAVSALGRGHPVAGGEPGDAVADLLHGARGLGAGGEGVADLVDAAALVGVDEVHARGGDLDQQLAGPGNGRAVFVEFRTSGPPGLAGDDCVHHVAPFPGGEFCPGPCGPS